MMRNREPGGFGAEEGSSSSTVRDRESMVVVIEGYLTRRSLARVRKSR
jgi:hypothetical protein